MFLRLIAFAAILCCNAGAAQADVLEVGEQGAVWIAGGASGVSRPRVPQAPASQSASFNNVPQRWRPHVAAAYARTGVRPKLIGALVWQESRWNPGARSQVGARGLAQLMPGTAAQLGVNPDNPASNLEGGARYLRTQLNTFGGDLPLALAAYNAGPARVQRARHVPAIAETRHYVASIMRHLLSN